MLVLKLKPVEIKKISAAGKEYIQTNLMDQKHNVSFPNDLCALKYLDLYQEIYIYNRGVHDFAKV